MDEVEKETSFQYWHNIFNSAVAKELVKSLKTQNFTVITAHDNALKYDDLLNEILIQDAIETWTKVMTPHIVRDNVFTALSLQLRCSTYRNSLLRSKEWRQFVCRLAGYILKSMDSGRENRTLNEENLKCDTSFIT